MFADLNDKLSAVFKRLRGEARISEANISDAVRQVRMALLEADVNYKVVKDFIERVREAALGEDVVKSVSPAQQFVKIVHDNLVEVLGGKDFAPGISLVSNPPTVIMLSGLQGSGKTTTAGKLASYLTKSGRSVLMIAADVYRPAAIEQLETLGRNLSVNVYSDKSSKDAVKIASDGLSYGRKTAADVVIVDTAGRLHIDENLMDEVVRVKNAVNPHYVFFVADAMTGQDAVNAASAFNERLDVTGIILTKTDGDARGGAALSVKAVTGKPLMFTGTGERPDEFEPFYPERAASRILGMGDVVTFVEKAAKAMESEDTQAMAGKLKTGLDFNDLLKQFKMMKKMGSLQSVLGMIPGMAKLNASDVDESRLKRAESIIFSMTPKERTNPVILNGSRKKRVAKGAGVTVTEVNRLIDQLSQMNKMVKKLGKKIGGKSEDAAAKELSGFFRNMR